VYPALTTWLALSEILQDSLDTLWVGGEGGMEADLVKRAGIRFEAIPAAGVHGVGVKALPGNVARLLRGYRSARRILNQFKPDVLFFTGGFVAIPVAAAAIRKPSVLYVPDIEPALAMSTLAYVSRKIAVTVEDSRNKYKAFLRKRLVVTGYPVRPEFKAYTRESSRQRLGLSQEMPVLLVSGGSKGARSINRALLAALPELLPGMQIIHLTGNLDWPEIQTRQETLRNQPDVAAWMDRYHPFPYLHDMGAALAAADLVVSRAGASSLGEYPFFGLPSILVPYPFAWKYQKVNAAWLQERGAALVIADEELTGKLSKSVLSLINDRECLAAMRAASKALSMPGAAGSIAGLLIQTAQNMNPGDNTHRSGQPAGPGRAL
jgi:UDP-N-acetylglucosamine--N-acetylmuramyl-(pentapeptide) pyrophosphoryl-undecaprenol N-acetylglucosamine transferase